jgi:hypothetical protein
MKLATTSNTFTFLGRWIPALAIALIAATASAATNPWLGAWALTIPGGGAGWLGVEDRGGQLQASMLWGGGSVFPLESARVDGDKLVLTRIHTIQRKDASGKTIKSQITETLTATATGDNLRFVSVKPRANGEGEERAEFTGKRQPPLPPAPNLSQIKFGEPISLFNGTDLAGWRLMESRAVNGWRAKDGLLVDEAIQEEGKPRKNYGNLRTDQEFEDFNLTLELRAQKRGNSGIYLRGIYEVQVSETHGKPLDSHNMGAIYSRITPTVAAEKPAGEWQTLDITLVERHVTVILNGKKIVDNQPLAGCTGGALWSDVTRPGPIYLQGDHTSVEYRNLVLRPRVK